MTDGEGKTGTRPLPAPAGGADERSVDPSGITADWSGEEAAAAIGQASASRDELEDNLSRLLAPPPGPEPAGPGAPTAPRSRAEDNVAFAPTQELSVLDDTAPTLPAAQAPDVAPELRPPSAPPAPRAGSRPGPRGRVVEASDQVVVFSEEQRQQLEQAIQRAERGQPTAAAEQGRLPLALILILAGLVAAAGVAGVLVLR